MRVFDRKNNCCIEEQEYGKKKLEFLYGTVLGRILLKLFFCRRIYSRLNAVSMKSKRSVKKIEPFAREHHIDLSEYEGVKFNSFDDFFTRKREYRCDADENALISPCDGRLSVYTIDDDLTLRIKSSVYTLSELTEGHFDTSQFNGGLCLVFRLAVSDYHRYVFNSDGRIVESCEINGVLHTVRSTSERYRVFCRNHRVCSLLDTAQFGEMIQIEVGALQVGKISNHPITKFSRLDEKGYFSYGGSTIIQLYKKDSAAISPDITKINADGTEVLVRIGETIGAVKKENRYA